VAIVTLGEEKKIDSLDFTTSLLWAHHLPHILANFCSKKWWVVCNERLFNIVTYANRCG